MKSGGSVRVEVDYNLCESNAICEALAPEVFEVRDDDVMYIIAPNPPEGTEDRVRQAVRDCPKQALTLYED